MPANKESIEGDVLKKRNTKIALRLAIFFACLLLLDFIIVSLIYSLVDWIAILIFSLLFIVPGYIANAGMVIVGGGKPIDGGKMWKDGRRIFGDHKTWRGLIKGPLFIGIPISIGIFLIFLILWPSIMEIQVAAAEMGQYKIYPDLIIYEYYFIGGPFPLGFLLLIVRIILCSYGAAVGDLIGSFLKRRFNIESGAPFWVVDQLDFVIFAIFFTSIPTFVFPTLFWVPDVNILIFLIILTPSVSIIANAIAYIIGIKAVPW
ncbi:MAG: CDP-2,3-bis-(O-geranylgeranyl)-sn-glycerol synthase [Promethearchaeota archaeon]